MRAICRRFTFVPSLLALLFLGASVAVATAPASEAQTPGIYANPANWLCRPDKSDPCDSNLNASIVRADGSVSIEAWAPAANPPVDCFYLYPTSSWDLADNSDRRPGTNEEIASTRTQAARFGSVCRLFVPTYRSVTSTWFIGAFLTAQSLTLPDRLLDIAYADVLAAFDHYLSIDNGGRGFVLIGHSQGSELLGRLVDDRIRGDATARARMVSALLLGLPGYSHPDPAVLPPCRSATQTGCHLAYTSFRATSPPHPDSGFARSTNPDDCTNPAALGASGTRTPLRSYFPAANFRWLTNGRWITTPFVTVPGLVEGACVTQGGFTYLSITVNAQPSDPRTDTIPGDLSGALAREYGLHFSDVQLALGDLVSVVGQQAAAYRSR